MQKKKRRSAHKNLGWSVCHCRHQQPSTLASWLTGMCAKTRLSCLPLQTSTAAAHKNAGKKIDENW
jgi:hypothetical protein